MNQIHSQNPHNGIFSSLYDHESMGKCEHFFIIQTSLQTFFLSFLMSGWLEHPTLPASTPYLRHVRQMSQV